MHHAPPATTLHARYSGYPHPRSDRDAYAYLDHPRTHRPRSTSRGRSSHSRSHSRGSDVSLDEMILEATATGDSDARALHASQHLHPSRHRSSSPNRGEYPVAGRARASSTAHLVPVRNHVVQPTSLPGQGSIVQHIFTPPVTGPPMKKTTLGTMGSNGSVMTTIGMWVLFPSPSLVLISPQAPTAASFPARPPSVVEGSPPPTHRASASAASAACPAATRMASASRSGVLAPRDLAPSATGNWHCSDR